MSAKSPSLEYGFGLFGAALLLLNGYGVFVIALRPAGIDSYVDFAGVETQPYQIALDELSAARALTVPERFDVATRVVHEAIAHVDPDDRARIGDKELRMHVPLSENYILSVLGYLLPSTYKDYEFCSYQKAITRGVGRCGQQALALVDFLASDGIETGFVNLGGHTVATARARDGDWYLLDPDYGAVIPFGINTAQSSPKAVLEFYWHPVSEEREIWRLYGPHGNRVKYGGPDSRWARACPIERAAYFLKWALPVTALVIALMIRRRRISLDRG